MTSKVLCTLSLLLTLATACDCAGSTTARGAVASSWTITVRGELATCARVSAASAALILHDRVSASDTVTTFPCADLSGSSQFVTAGTYDARMELHAADGAQLATMPMASGLTILSGQLVPLATVFNLDDRGALAISIAALASTENCADASQRGAAINGTSLLVERVGDGCAPLTFTRTRGTETLGTYRAEDCSAPAVIDCIERDETLTVEALSSGLYTISVFGHTGALSCWRGDDILAVPTAGVTLHQKIQLARVPQAGC